MNDNFVDIVGFQLERVHTGMLGWLLSTEALPPESRIALLNGLSSPPMLPASACIGPIRARPEFSISSGRIDLVLEVTLAAGAPYHLVIECKTDSDLSIGQLEQSRRGFLESSHGLQTRPQADRCRSIALLLGAGAFTHQTHDASLRALSYTVVDTPQMVRMLADLVPRGMCPRLDEWRAALSRELERWAQIEAALHAAGRLSSEELPRRGYRPGFPVLYTAYHRLRHELCCLTQRTWAVYSGGNNAVMSLQHGGVTIGGIPMHFEFNDEALTLKAKVENCPESRWQQMRQAVQALCGQAGFGGRNPRNRSGRWCSVYKWQFNFCRQPLVEIATRTEQIITCVQRLLWAQAAQATPTP